MAKKRGLGRGLDSLLPRESTEQGRVLELDVDEIRPNPYQPRKDFSTEAMESLKESVEEHGVIQPILVKKVDQGYEIVAGERRYRAARMAQLDKVPAIVVEVKSAKQAEMALIENLQREDLNPAEEAEGFKCLMDEHHMTQEELARSVSKSRSYVANALRLLSLPEDVLNLLRNGSISAGHARTLLMFDEPKRLEMAQLTIEKELTVRELEQLAKKKPAVRTTRPKKDIHLRDMEKQLEEVLGTRVLLRDSSVRKSVEISFYSREEMEDFLEMLMNVSRETSG
jgi:ParB family chromosome partitioning protein